MRTKLGKDGFMCSGQLITWSMFQKIVNILRGDREMAAKIFYRANYNKAKDVMAWISDGLKNKPQYALLPCQDEIDYPKSVRSWIDSEIYRIVPSKISIALKQTLLEMAEKL